MYQLEREKFIQAVLDAFPAHVAILDETGTIVAVNEAWKRFAGNNQYPGNHYGVGLNYLAVCENARGRDADESRAVGQGIREVIYRRRDEFVLEYPCHSPRVKRWFNVQVTRFNWDGQIRVVVAHHNVTELKKVQLELEDSRHRIEAILNHVPSGIIALSAGGRVESINPAALAIFGYEASEITGKEISLLLADTTMSFRRLMTLLETTHEITGQRKDGTTFPMHLALSEMVVGHRRMYTGILEDLTERKRIEAELLEKERIALALDKERELRDFKGSFMSIMSHELRTPLASIQLSSDLLKRYGEQAPEEERRAYLDNITTQIEHLAALIKDMSAMSRRTEVSEGDFTPRKTDFIALCRKIVEEYQLAHESTHRIDFFTGCSRLNVSVDLKLMRQVLNNLLANAVKYSPSGSEIKLEVWRESKRIVLTVTDEGIGIPPADLPLLFEPFHRASNVDDIPGTGLGLAVVRQSLEKHGGSIEVESEPGQGTTFTVYLPWQE